MLWCHECSVTWSLFCNRYTSLLNHILSFYAKCRWWYKLYSNGIWNRCCYTSLLLSLDQLTLNRTLKSVKCRCNRLNPKISAHKRFQTRFITGFVKFKAHQTQFSPNVIAKYSEIKYQQGLLLHLLFFKLAGNENVCDEGHPRWH